MESTSLDNLKQKAIEAKNILRPYQIEVLTDMYKHGRWLNYMDMGMGKGLVTLLAVIGRQAFPCVILCNKAAMGVLANELEKWFDLPSVIYSGKPKQRDEAWGEYIDGDYQFIIANYAMGAELAERFGLWKVDKPKMKYNNGRTLTAKGRIPTNTLVRKPQALVCDEIHTAGLFNHTTATYKLIAKLAAQVNTCYLLTGTPYRKGMVDFFGPLSIVDSKKFDSYWKYVHRYGITIDTGYGKAIERNPNNATKFREMVRQHASIMKKQDYLHDLPEKIRSVLPVEMNEEQQKIYDELTEELMAFTDDGELIITPSSLTLMIRQRQLLVCPQELGLKHRGAAIDTIIDMVEDHCIEDKPFTIFTPFRKAVKWVRKALEDEYPGIPVYEITGGLTDAEFTNTWKGFQEGAGNGKGFRVLICVIKSSAAFHATAADTAFFLGCEYDFNQNAQAEDRLYRIGQTRPVNCYYLLHRNTIDDSIVQILNDKAFSADIVLAPDQVYREMMERRKKK